MAAQPAVSIIVPVHNGAATIAQCIEACLQQDYPVEKVIVVDDGSTDDTARICKEHEVTYVYQANSGPAAARNHGAQLAATDIIAYTDCDCIPESGWIGHLVSGFEPGVAGVGGTYTIANPESALARMIQAEIAFRHNRFGREVDFLGSFNVAYDKAAFDAADGFDETFKAASGEDNDLAYRLHDAGGRLIFEGQARVAHHHPDRIWPYLRTQARHGYWRVKLYSKHPGRRTGDRYAGRFELLAPPFALALAVLWALFPLTRGIALQLPATFGYVYLGVYAVAFCGFLIYLPKRFRDAIDISGNADGVALLPLVFMFIVRDVARGVGLAEGLIRYLAFGRDGM